MSIQSYHTLLSAIRLLIAQDRDDGRFVFNRQVLHNPRPSIVAAQTTILSRTESGPGGDNSKSQLQTLLTRAGYGTPVYRTMQLKNGQFQATVQFNGMEVMGQPCNNKKQAEKDAASHSLELLFGGKRMGHDYIEQMSLFLKKSKRDHR